MSYQCLSVAEAVSLLQTTVDGGVTVFDVRDVVSYRQSHVPGAAHLAESRIPLWLGKLAKDDPILIYCYHGNSSQAVAQLFADFRFTRVYSVDGGYGPLAAALAEAG